MKNKIPVIFLFLILSLSLSSVFAESLSIQSGKINIDKNKQITIFQNNVIFKTQDNKTIKSEYAEYDKKNGLIKLKDQVTLQDEKNNIILTEDAEYFESKKQFKSYGKTIIKTYDGYTIESQNILLDKKKLFQKTILLLRI